MHYLETRSSRQVARLATGAAGPAPWAGGRIDDVHLVPGADNVDELKPAADDLGSAEKPQRLVAARARPVRLAAMPFAVAVEEFTDGSDIATQRRREAPRASSTLRTAIAGLLPPPDDPSPLTDRAKEQ
jgi:hypothetical protein